jgi:phosphohistidine phosphatase SixA
MSSVEAHMTRSRQAFAGFFVWILLMTIPGAQGGQPNVDLPGAPCAGGAGVTGTEPAAAHPVVVYLVRHAEKASSGGKDPELTEAGRARALALAHTLGDAGIDTIHSTDLIRTRETAAPLAERLGVAVRVYRWDALAALATAMKCAGGRHLVVGHSDTTPELVGLLGGEPGPAIDEQSEYDRLYLLSISPDGSVNSVLLRYGEM